jgi:hypothetical protein
MQKTLVMVATVMCMTQLGAQTPPQSTTGTRRIPQFENDHVRVWKSIIEPKQPLTQHRHDHGRTLVALVGGTIKIVQADGSSKNVVWETGKAYWLDADPPGQTHADVNEGAKAIEVIVVEMKK